jgi:hypothetical protein
MALEFEVIAPAKWDKAEWRGVLYIVDRTLARPPIFGLMFRHETPAVDIFTDWRSRMGRDDENGQIRVAIVEGDIPGQDYGYTVHIGPNPQSALDDAADSNKSRVVSFSRIFRMNPDRNSQNLPNFKEAFALKKKCLMLPVIANREIITGDNIKPLLEFGLIGRNLVFKNVKDVGSNDIDSAVFIGAT